MLDELLAERKRLDALLDDALEQFALYEEEMNPRMKAAQSPDELQMLINERSIMEETLGIADLVIRIDELREHIDQLKSQAA